MHFSMFKSCISVSLGSLLLGLTASAQTPDNPLQVTQTKLPLKADLVLSPEFCDTRQRQSIAFKDVLRVGEPACSQLEAELNKVFSLLRTVETIPAPGTSSAEVVLIPRFVDISATKPMLPSSQRELVILLEWTIQNTAGRTIWLQTGSGVVSPQTRLVDYSKGSESAH
jgi:hypothetical protein